MAINCRLAIHRFDSANSVTTCAVFLANLGNGNTMSGTATVTRTNGTTTLAETVGVAADTTAANLNLTNNPFYREFTTPVAPSTAAQALPEMGGAGWVRDLREAMSLGTAQGDALAAKVAEFAQATTRDGQMALLDDLLRLWAETNQSQAMGAVDDPRRRFVLTVPLPPPSCNGRSRSWRCSTAWASMTLACRRPVPARAATGCRC